MQAAGILNTIVSFVGRVGNVDTFNLRSDDTHGKSSPWGRLDVSWIVLPLSRKDDMHDLWREQIVVCRIIVMLSFIFLVSLEGSRIPITECRATHIYTPAQSTY